MGAARLAIEIERKFLLASDAWRAAAGGGQRMSQGYLGSEAGCSVRVRVAGEQAWLNIKSATRGISRDEYEYAIPVADGRRILDTLAQRPLIDKTRYTLRVGAHLWEIDEFHGDNAGLLVAEIELGHADECFVRPAWLGREVSDDPRYLNASLRRHPFRAWRTDA